VRPGRRTPEGHSPDKPVTDVHIPAYEIRVTHLHFLHTPGRVAKSCINTTVYPRVSQCIASSFQRACCTLGLAQEGPAPCCAIVCVATVHEFVECVRQCSVQGRSVSTDLDEGCRILTGGLPPTAEADHRAWCKPTSCKDPSRIMRTNQWVCRLNSGRLVTPKSSCCLSSSNFLTWGASHGRA